MKKILATAAAAAIAASIAACSSSTDDRSAEALDACTEVVEGHTAAYDGTSTDFAGMEAEKIDSDHYMVWGEYSTTNYGELKQQGFKCDVDFTDDPATARVDRWGADKDAVKNPTATPVTPRPSSSAAAADEPVALSPDRDPEAVAEALADLGFEMSPADIDEAATVTCEALAAGIPPREIADILADGAPDLATDQLSRMALLHMQLDYCPDLVKEVALD